MNSTAYTAPSQFVKHVVNTLGQRLNIEIESAYQREASELKSARVAYHTGDVDSESGYASDGRKQHEVEIRFLVYVPIVKSDFELEALDLACRIERELLETTWQSGGVHDTLTIESNVPRKFAPEQGFFLRVVTVRQQIRVGPLDEQWHQIVGDDLDVVTP
ncbi:hypothetical protein [Salinivibrio proteolyticus]|uniref:hypothetical protein n=1 Tax=Salinivibrio proteolyticus TaxID=334715 RepID=UPI0009890E77|nr:hypothetical protein [Salinivibrio proteolyticus]